MLWGLPSGIHGNHFSDPQALGEMLREELSLLIATAADAPYCILFKLATLGQLQFWPEPLDGVHCSLLVCPEKASRTMLGYGAVRPTKTKRKIATVKTKIRGISLKLSYFYTLNSFFFSLMQIMLRWRTSVVFSLLHSSKIIPNIWAGPKPMSDSLAIPGNLLLNFILQCWRRYK